MTQLLFVAYDNGWVISKGLRGLWQGETYLGRVMRALSKEAWVVILPLLCSVYKERE
jgi:hypothetical protein